MLLPVISSKRLDHEVSMMDRYFFRRRFLVAVATAAFVAALPKAAAAQDRRDNTLHRLNESVDALIKKISPSVVQILVSGYGPIESSERGNTALTLGRQRAIGSGFVIDPTGFIVTNAH
jgi:S1-C subfamily serine protease